MTNTNYGLYRVQAKTAWTGDQWGNEWLLGWVVVPDMDSAHGDGEPMFALYEDDGRGNGNYVASFNTLAEAKQAADRHVAAADGDPEVAPFFPVHEPSPLELSPDAAAEWTIDARMAEAYGGYGEVSHGK
jgi:hypothetical protein